MKWFLCGEAPPTRVSSVSFHMVVVASFLLHCLASWISSTRTKCIFRDGQTTLFTGALAAEAGAGRGWSAERKVDIPGGGPLENLIMFSGTQCRTRWWRRGDKDKKEPFSFPFTCRVDDTQRPGRLWMATNSLNEEKIYHTIVCIEKLDVRMFCQLQYRTSKSPF